MTTHIVADLGGIDEQRGLAARGHQGKGERERRVADVGAADVEQPGDGIEQGEEHRIGLVALQVSCTSAIFLSGAPPGKFETMRDHRSGGGGRAVLP